MMDAVIETDRLCLRKIQLADYRSICAILQDMDVMYAWEHAFSDSEVLEWINENLRRYDRDGYSYWAVIEKSSGRFIGVAGLLAEEADGERYLGVGYIFNQAYWHKGYAFESASACVGYAAGVLHSGEVTAQIRPENTPSRKVAEKLGMHVKKQFVRRYKEKDMPHLLYSRVLGDGIGGASDNKGL